jgi:hypothetical protein
MSTTIISTTAGSNTTAVNATPPMSFEEKLKTRIKDSVGELLTDEDLSALIHKSMTEVFFTRRPNPEYNYYNKDRPEYLPPLLHSLVKECLQPAVNAAVKAWIERNNEAVEESVKAIVTNGVGNAVLTALNNQFQSQLITFQQNLMSSLNRG